MKKTISVALAILLILCQIPFVTANTNDELIPNGDFKNGLSGWKITTPNANAGLKTDESEPYVKILADETTTSAQLVSPTVHIDADTKYELNFFVRVPEDAEFDPTKASSPNFGIFEPSQKGANGQTAYTYAEGQNNYAYSYAADFTVTRRTAFRSTWTIDGHPTQSVNGYSNFGAKIHYTDGQGIGVSPKEAYKDWTKVTVVFDTIADDKNTAEADIAIGFVIKFPGGIMDIKKVSLKVWQEPPPSGAFVLPDENGIKGGYITEYYMNYTASAYDGNEFLGWYDANDNLVSTDTTIAAESDTAYYGAKFKNSNLILDSGFENYKDGYVIFDAALNEKQDYSVYSLQSTTVLNSPSLTWANLRINSKLAHSGSKSMGGLTFHQTVGTPVGLKPNTKYSLSFWYCYETSDPNCYVNSIAFGIYKPNTAADKMEGAKGENTTATVSETKDFAPKQWKKAHLAFTTYENCDDLLFCYRYTDSNSAGLSAINKTTLYLDDVVIMPYENLIKSKVTVDLKTAASVEPTGTDFDALSVGDEASFKVITQKGLTPTVKINGTAVLPDANGIYRFIAEENTLIKVVCNGDENRRDANKDKFGRDLTKYNPEIYMENFWSGNTVYHEPVLFYTGRTTAKLLYPISEIISVRSYDLKTNYIEGVDYEITSDGRIKRLEGSRIPVYTAPLTKVPSTDIEKAFLTKADGSESLAFIGDTVYPTFAVAITYEHTKNWQGDEGYNPYALGSQAAKLKKTMEKLKNGEKVNIIIFGDSGSCGWSASGLNSVGEIYDDTNTEGNFKNYVINVAPYTPTWIDMFISKLQNTYKDAEIEVKNLALGGKNSSWGKNALAQRLKLLGDWTPDLMILCFAGNDASSNMSNQTYKANFKGMIDLFRDPSVKGANPNGEVLLWSQNLPNTKAVTYSVERFKGYEDQLAELVNENEKVALQKITSAYIEIIKSKEAVDYLNTNVNHGNDFTVRMIAQGLYAAFVPTEGTAGDLNSDGEVNLNDVVTLAQVVAGWQDVDHDPSKTDLNGDGLVNLNDVVTLAQAVAGWDVKIY